MHLHRSLFVFLTAALALVAGPYVHAQAPAKNVGHPMGITSADPSWGSHTAAVTIVEYSDFQ